MQESQAAEKLPVVLLEDLQGKPAFQTLLEAIKNSGFTPRAVREEDFSFNIDPKRNPVVVVPVGRHVNPESLAMLNRYVAAGGRIVLIPCGGNADASVTSLFATVGMVVEGQIFAPQALSFNWKGMARPSGEALPPESRLLLIQPSAQMNVLATWGSDVPAIASTERGAVLNWQWGKQLSGTSNAVALSQVIYPGRAEPINLLKPAEPERMALAETAPVNPGSVNSQTTPALTPTVQPNAKLERPALIPVSKPEAQAAAPASAPGNPPAAPAESAEKISGATQKSPEPQVTGPQPVKPQEVKTQAGEVQTNSKMPSATAPNPAPGLPEVAKKTPAPAQQKLAPSAPSAPIAAQKTNAGSAAAKDKSADSAENEVINNILGLPEGTGQKPAATANPTGEAKQQKHFSFLDPEAASVIAPEFDYGVYSMNLRKLDDYKRRVRDALEAGRQLSLDLPEDKVNVLLKEANDHKRKFESLYLSGQTQAGLDENALAQRTALRALALTTTSPQVEGRAIWLDRGSIIESGGPEGLKKRMQKLHQAGINIVYFETINAGFPIYPSKLVKRNPLVSGWDPLQVAVDEGHRLGMEVHAWVWAFAVGNRRHNELINQPEEYAGPILTEAGMMSEALRNRAGGLSVDSRQHEFWLSPASPKAREFLLNYYKEIVTHYDVDGLQLDYIRYPFQTSGNLMGFEAVGRERFAHATGQSLDNFDEYTNRVWTAWKTYQVSLFVQQVSTTLKGIKPELKLSAAVFPMRREARIAAIQQDWETWIDNGWIDTLSPMSYTTDPDRLQEMFVYVQHSPRKHALVYPGIALHRLDGGQLVQHLEALRQKGGLGTTLFAGSHLDDDKANTLGAGPFKQIDSLPPHHDLVKSMQMIVADYQQKLTILSKKGGLKDFPAEQMETLQLALQRLTEALAGLGSGRPLTGISPQKLQVAQQRLNELQTLSNAWSASDKMSHPYRAEYFEHDLLLMNELMGYTVDHVGDRLGIAPATTADVHRLNGAPNHLPNQVPSTESTANLK